MTEDEPLTCLDDYKGEECEGPVEYRWVGEKAWPRCERHHRERLDARENSLEIEAQSASPPEWFDPSYAGERWDEDY